MRLITFSPPAGAPRAGLDAGGIAIDLAAAAEREGGPELAAAARNGVRGLLAAGLDTVAPVVEAIGADPVAALADGTGWPLADVDLGPPVPDPGKIICLGLNYRDHADECGLAHPEAPMFFPKYANSLVGTGAVVHPPLETERVDYEAELAVVIGRRGRRIGVVDALAHVAGAMALNDISARDLQLSNQLWTRGKAIDGFAPCGPALVTLDELGDPQALGIRTRLNGAVMQDGTTADMIFPIAEAIAFLSTTMTLEPGDVIATGTPAGVGQSRTPPVFMVAGDVVEVEIDGIGLVRTEIGAPA
ncbi:MAG: fumarylacetoacetate hydrolase family protein [Actinomycetota bacterium]